MFNCALRLLDCTAELYFTRNTRLAHVLSRYVNPSWRCCVSAQRTFLTPYSFSALHVRANKISTDVTVLCLSTEDYI
jgi:hypothetical protein